MGTFTNYSQNKCNYKVFENKLPIKLPDLIILFNLDDIKHSALILEANERNIPIIAIVSINSIHLKNITYPIIICNNKMVLYLNYFFFNLLCEYIYFLKIQFLKNPVNFKKYNYKNNNLIKNYKKSYINKKQNTK